MRWFYLWSPKYELFHQMLQFCLTDCSGIFLNPVFIPQSYFSQSLSQQEHAFTGNAIKLRMIVKALKACPGQQIMFTDADVMVLRHDGLLDYFNSYREYDLVCMREGTDNPAYNIGMMMIRSMPETIEFIELLIERVEKDRAHDQTELNCLIAEFKGTHTSFSYPEIIQSNNYMDDMNPYIIQCLSSLPGYTQSFAEKLASVVGFFDITPFRQFISKDVEEILKKVVLESAPDHYLKDWD